MSTFQAGDDVVYTLHVANIKPRYLRDVEAALHSSQVPTQYQQRDGDDTITVARLCTTWRGDEAETTWQRLLHEAVQRANHSTEKSAADITIGAVAWQLLPGYPQGDLDL